MSRIYDNWERLVAATLRKEQLWQLFHQDSMDSTSSTRSMSTDFSSASNLSSPFNDVLKYEQRQHHRAYSSDLMWQINDESVWENVPKQEYLGFNSPAFGYEALLIPSVEALAKGKSVASYKTAIEDGITIVVRRLRGTESVSQLEFQKSMEVSGSIKEENLATPTAYFSYEDEKLIIYEYRNRGSQLHGMLIFPPQKIFFRGSNVAAL